MFGVESATAKRHRRYVYEVDMDMFVFYVGTSRSDEAIYQASYQEVFWSQLVTNRVTSQVAWCAGYIDDYEL